MVRAASTADAVRGADIVTTVTADKAYATIVTADMIGPGMHLNAVGGDCPARPNSKRACCMPAAYSSNSSRSRASRARSSRCRPTSPSPSCGACCRGETTGRERADEVTVFDSVGFALEDYSALRYLYALAQHNAGVEIALIPPAVDPKNLFALIDDPAAIAQGHAAYVTDAVAAFAR